MDVVHLVQIKQNTFLGDRIDFINKMVEVIVVVSLFVNISIQIDNLVIVSQIEPTLFVIKPVINREITRLLDIKTNRTRQVIIVVFKTNVVLLVVVRFDREVYLKEI